MSEAGGNIFYAHLKEHLTLENIYINYKLSYVALHRLQRITSICEQKNIKPNLFIHPSHGLQWEGIRVAGRWEEFEDWKKELVKISPVWDFSGYNSITSTPPYNYDLYFDQSHYRKRVGNLVLNRMLNIHEGSGPEDFGYLITTDNIDQHMQRIREERTRWQKDNPEIIKSIEMLIEK